jgi:hypothetical protein
MDAMEKLSREALHRQLELTTRRHFLRECRTGIGMMGLGSLLAGCDWLGGKNQAASSMSHAIGSNPMSPRTPHFAPRARSVIYLHMAGAPSQLELFDYKPELAKLNGQECPPSLLEGKKFAFIRGVPKMLGPQTGFRQYGESGIWLSDLLPHFRQVADDVTVIKTVNTDQFNHGPAQLLMHCGTPRLGRPSMGAWVSYGLGSDNSNLPGFIVLTSGGKNPDAGKSVWGSGFLPSVYQGVQCRSEGEPVLFLEDPEGMDRDLRKATIESIGEINRLTHEQIGDPETLSRIAQYEMAYKMQTAVPEVMNINDEPSHIHELYGTQPGKTSLANNILLARKLVEKGVRFVQIFDWGWDTHGTGPDGSLDIGLVNKTRQVDRAMTALILDLKQRGLLDETLVVWGGEFGRTPMQENREGKQNPYTGRDHHSEAFCMWMAGGGIKKGHSHGETDEIGYSAVKDKVSVYDIQATILNQLGFDHEKLTYDFQGRPFRLTDVHGSVIQDIIS